MSTADEIEALKAVQIAIQRVAELSEIDTMTNSDVLSALWNEIDTQILGKLGAYD